MKKVMFLLALMLGLLLEMQGQKDGWYQLKGADPIQTASDTAMLFPGAVDAYLSGKNFSGEEALHRLKTGDSLYSPNAMKLAFANDIRYLYFVETQNQGMEFRNIQALDEHIEGQMGRHPEQALDFWLKNPGENFAVKTPNAEEEYLNGGTLIIEGEHVPFYREGRPLYEKGDELPRGVTALEDELHLGVRAGSIFPNSTSVDPDYYFSFVSLICMNFVQQKFIPLREEEETPTANIDRRKTTSAPRGFEMVGFQTEYYYSQQVVSMQYIPMNQPVFYCGVILRNSCWNGCWNYAPAPMNWCYPTCCGGGNGGGVGGSSNTNNNTNDITIINNIYNYGDDEPDPDDDDEDPDPIDDGGPILGENGDDDPTPVDDGGPILGENNDGGIQSEFEYQNLELEGVQETADVVATPKPKPQVEEKAPVKLPVFDSVQYQADVWAGSGIDVASIKKPVSKPNPQTESSKLPVFNATTYEDKQPFVKPNTNSGLGESVAINNTKPQPEGKLPVFNGLSYEMPALEKPRDPIQQPNYSGSGYGATEFSRDPALNYGAGYADGGNTFRNPNTSLTGYDGGGTRNPYNQGNSQGSTAYSKPDRRPNTNVSLDGGYQPATANRNPNTQSHNSGNGGGGKFTAPAPVYSNPSLAGGGTTGSGGGFSNSSSSVKAPAMSSVRGGSGGGLRK